MENLTHVVTGKVRLSYVSLVQPRANEDGQEPKYGCTVLIPKSDTATLAKLEAAADAAKKKGASLWGGTIPPKVDIPLRDGDGARPSDGMPYGDECKGHWVMNVSAKRRPRVVDINRNDIINPDEIYSGMYARVSVDFYPYATAGKKGVGIGLNNVQKLADGEMLGGGTTPDQDFGDDLTSLGI